MGIISYSKYSSWHILYVERTLGNFPLILLLSPVKQDFFIYIESPEEKR
ncbi:hypothetical protein J559_0882 [Acinetobacter sp. 983759]|nr:hypothetical protein J559_0882 [Acinetobacter sp. 983759]